MELPDIVNQLVGANEKINLIYAFNATGKTRLSVAYKNATKTGEGQHTGVYYNAFSEDLFVWDNDLENDGQNLRLVIKPSFLNQFHSPLTEESVLEKLNLFKPKFFFNFNLYEDTERGIESISFFLPGKEGEFIKISRGEERIFVWCFFLALFEVEAWMDQQSDYFFIDDPVSSLDDHNIFITASTLYNLIDNHYTKRKIIITTHHIGLFSILADWLTKGEKSSRYKDITKLYILSRKNGDLTLERPNKDVFLYHLHILQALEQAQNDQLYTFHFALLRQVLENIASFLGVGQFGYVLSQIGINDPNQVASIVNTLAHQKVYHYQTDVMNQDNEDLFREIFDKIKAKYNFVLHAS